ncbi:beta-barrel assembly-enhancing protease [Methylotetracoccus oryzae]|uniref:beta-barrel assembly-enhancing protease n=1 Tax=Methylotetracoccus oryzae TaxID=1919059 RepID=UPI00111A83F4|nr:M48 family metalloprotease [Methylotetracoccus oryzae]
MIQSRPFILSALLAAQLCCVPQARADEPLNLQLPDIGDPTGTSFTPLQEQQLGEAFYRNLHAQLEISQDPEATDYIQNLGQRLTTNSDKPEQPFHFFIVNSAQINAFAGPGGFIGVNSGLILASETESELASVMAHEIAHVTQRHLFQAFQDSSRLSLPMAAAMLAAMLVGSQSAQGGQAALLATQAAMAQHQINFTRDNEAEADRVGMQILSKSAFDPRGMPTFFERLQQSTRFSGHSAPEFLLTHPVTTSRISDTRGRADSFPYRQYPDSIVYQLIRAKLRVASTRDAKNAVSYFKLIEGQGTTEQQDVARYGLALALIRNFQTREGQDLLRQLIRKYPDQPYFVSALGESQMEAKDYAAAEQTFEAGLKRFPDYRSMMLNYVRTSLTARKPEQARKLLQQYTLRNKPGPGIYELMAEIYGQLGQEAESHRFVAEYYYASGQTRAAMQQLVLARRAAGDNHYVAAVIDERLKELREEEMDRRKEE